MVKKISLIILVLMLFSTAYAREMPTRAEFCIQLAKALEIKSDTNFPLLSYSDWSQIDISNRNMVSAVLKTGIFAPNEKIMQPNKVIDQADINTAIFGLIRYVASNEELNITQGTIIAKAGEAITLQVGDNKYYTNNSCLYIGDNISTLSNLETSDRVDFILNKAGNVLLCWNPKESLNIKTKILSGDLYLYNEKDDSLIMKNVKEYWDREWLDTTIKRYSIMKLSPSTLIVNDGKIVRRSELNENFLDHKITLIMSGTMETQNILYIKMQ